MNKNQRIANLEKRIAELETERKTPVEVNSPSGKSGGANPETVRKTPEVAVNWKQKNCLTCTYQVSNFCRRFPPSVCDVDGWFLYPEVKNGMGMGGKASSACAEYKPD